MPVSRILIGILIAIIAFVILLMFSIFLAKGGSAASDKLLNTTDETIKEILPIIPFYSKRGKVINFVVGLILVLVGVIVFTLFSMHMVGKGKEMASHLINITNKTIG